MTIGDKRMKGIVRLPSPAMVVACVALAFAVGGTSYAALSLPANSVGTKQIKNGAVTKKKISARTIAALRGLRGARGPVGPEGPEGPTGPTGAQGPPGIVNVGRVQLTTAEVDPAARSEFKAFIRTDSSNRKCLVTPNESNAVQTGTTIYCGTRNYNGADGIFIHVFLPSPATTGLTIDMTVYQESAQQYALPVFYPGP